MTNALPNPKDRRVADAILAARAYYQKPGNEVGGALHTALDDGNLDDRDIAFCLWCAEDKGDVEGAALASALLGMSMTQRRKVYKSFHVRNESREERMSDPMQWNGRLLDAEAAHDACPDTFELPTLAERVSVHASAYVKLGFLLDQPADGFEGERMWVRVIGVSFNRDDRGNPCDVSYSGILTNVPAVLNMDKHASKAGYSVGFEPKHILATMPSTSALRLI